MAIQNWTSEDDWNSEEFVCKAIHIAPAVEGVAQTDGSRRNAPTEMEFPEAFYRMFLRDSLAFPVEYRGQLITVVVSRETLVKQYGAKDTNLEDAESAFFGNMAKLQELAKTHIQKGVSTDEYEIVLR